MPLWRKGQRNRPEAACRQVAQAGMEPVSGLGGAAGVHVLNDMRCAVQHQDHLAFELGWQNRLHIVARPANAGLFWRLRRLWSRSL